VDTVKSECGHVFDSDRVRDRTYSTSHWSDGIFDERPKQRSPPIQSSAVTAPSSVDAGADNDSREEGAVAVAANAAAAAAG